MNKGRTSVQAAWTAALALALLVCGWSSTPGQEGESAKSDKLPAGSARPQLTKLPMAYHDSMENTPVICDARPLLVLNYRNDTKNRTDEYKRSMYLYIRDLRTGQEIARFGEGHSFVSGFVHGTELSVFASEGTNYDWMQSIYRFSTTDLKSWKRELAIPVVDGEHLFNCSVCQDGQGFVMAYESNLPVQFCFKFARSKDLARWEKVDGLVFAGPDGKTYSACPVIRYFAPYYYVIYLHLPVPDHNGYVSFLARSTDLVTWQLSPLNPVLAAGPGEGINNSDVDLFEWDGKTYLYYATGNQSDWATVRMAMYAGPMREFFEKWFPAEAKMQANLHRTNLDKIPFRVQDKAFFGTVTELLARRHAYSDTLWSYAIKHNEPAAVREYLQHADGFVGQCGAFIDSPLLTIDPVARNAYQHLDYRPLVNARAHPLGPRRQIVNDRFHAQYHQLLKILSYRRDLDDPELMAVTYYLLLQDRVDEALGTFARVRAERLATRLQYDYFAAYLAMFREQPQQARDIVAKYAEHPVDRWRDLFGALLAQLDEIDSARRESPSARRGSPSARRGSPSARRGSPDPAETPDRQVSGEPGRPTVDSVARSGDRPQQASGDRPQLEVHTKLAATEASFDFQVEAKKVTLNYQNLKQVQVNYYLMDIELLFSRNPFVQQYSGQFSNIRPNLTQALDLPEKQATTVFELPKQLHSSNVLVEISGAGQTKSRPYYANALAVQVVENYGQIHVKHSDTGQPLAKVYVKVYAQMQDDRVKFYKDGYTDLRGRFDYTSLSTNELDFVKKFSLLVLSEEHGAVVREASPPQR